MRKTRLLAAALALSIAFCGIATVTADEIDDIKNQQAMSQAELDQVNQNINTREEDKNVLLGQIDSVGQELVLTMVQVETLAGEIEAKNAELEVTAANLAAAEEDKAVQYEAMKKRIQYLYENGGNAGWATILLEESDITELLNQAEYTQKMYKYDRECLEQYASTVQQVAALQQQQQLEQSELVAMKNEQELQQANLEALLENLKATNANYDAALANAQNLANQYRDLIAQQSEQIAVLEEQKRQEELAAQAAAEEAARQQAAAEEAARQQAAAEEAARQEAANQVQQDNSTPDYVAPAPSEPEYSEPEYSEPDPAPSVPGDSSSYAAGQAIADYACQFVGNPYVWGGNSLTNGTDCSGFVHLVYAAFGYSVPRSSASMPGAGWTSVSYSEMQPGDIICYSGHCGLYIGGGQMVHASNETVGIIISSNINYRPIIAIRRVV